MLMSLWSMELAILLTALIFLVFMNVLLLSLMISALQHVPFVPSSKKARQIMLSAVKINPGHRVYDLGCGDGRLVIEAAKKFGARATGFEISPFVYLLGRIKNYCNGSPAEIKMKNFFKVNLSDADVIFCYLFPKVMKKLGEKFTNELKPGTKIVSNAFRIENWTPIQSFPTRTDKPNSFLIHVYEVGKQNI